MQSDFGSKVNTNKSHSISPTVTGCIFPPKGPAYAMTYFLGPKTIGAIAIWYPHSGLLITSLREYNWNMLWVDDYNMTMCCLFNIFSICWNWIWIDSTVYWIKSLLTLFWTSVSSMSSVCMRQRTRLNLSQVYQWTSIGATFCHLTLMLLASVAAAEWELGILHTAEKLFPHRVNIGCIFRLPSSHSAAGHRGEQHYSESSILEDDSSPPIQSSGEGSYNDRSWLAVRACRLCPSTSLSFGTHLLRSVCFLILVPVTSEPVVWWRALERRLA